MINLNVDETGKDLNTCIYDSAKMSMNQKGLFLKQKQKYKQAPWLDSEHVSMKKHMIC